MYYLLFLICLALTTANINEYIDPLQPDWFDAENWSLNRVPTENDTALIRNKYVILYGTETKIKNLWLKSNAIFALYNKLNIREEFLIQDSTILLFNNLSFPSITNSNALIWLMNNACLETKTPVHLHKSDVMIVGLDSPKSIVTSHLINDGGLTLLPSSNLKVENFNQSVTGHLTIQTDNNFGLIVADQISMFGLLKLKQYYQPHMKSSAICRPILLGQIKNFNVTLEQNLKNFGGLHVSKTAVVLCLQSETTPTRNSC